MKYSLVDGIKSEPFQKGKGICECCSKATIAKCGNVKIHHWSHVSLSECDNWWENETKWHRDWKNLFPTSWQEVTHKDEVTGEIHRADVKTDYGLVVELQNSPISYQEQTSRERFYKNMIWIVNGEKFKKNFHILDKLPNPSDKFTKDIVFKTRKKDDLGRSFFRLSENPDFFKPKFEGQLFRATSLNKINDEIEQSYIGHHLFHWVRPIENWLSFDSEVFIDFGDESLYRLYQYADYKLPVVRKYDKESIIERILIGKKKTLTYEIFSKSL